MDRTPAHRLWRGQPAGYHWPVRLAGTAIICILAAFGAAFLVARSVNHQTPARAATAPAKTTRVADTTAAVAGPHKVNVELVSQFAPIAGAKLKPRPKPHRKHKKVKPAVPVAPSVSNPVTTTPAYTTTTPTYTSPPPTYTAPAPTQTPTHKKKSGGSSGGSGTTTIGG
jgi:hypothetical protein